MTEETLTRIRQHIETLKLLGIQKVLDQELARAAQQALPPTELLERLLAIEANARIERRIERRIKESRLPERKLLSDFDFAFQAGVDKAQVLEIAKLDFVGRKQGLVISGNSGTG
ncbi:MAG: ATP-binding protein, partial [Deltaproteobacteria bacterium]|nr:ATP-binding protein [Deltaproteobacteria bacterium]